MQTKMSRAKVVVYVLFSVLALAVFTAAVLYLPGLMQSLHGTG